MWDGGWINWNFSEASFRSWYAEAQRHLVADGFDFYWNDEGETSWFTYLGWNIAQQAQFTSAKPNRRHLTINRAWQSGMQRYAAITWTGDGADCSHQELLRGMMHGSPLTSCDLTSPDPTMLVRQYQSAVFSPIMRVQQMQGTPRFPWFWGGACGPGTGGRDFPNCSLGATRPLWEAHQRAFRSALAMRYGFLPFLYSLAHAAFRSGRPIAHPASFVFQHDPAAADTYMVGGVLLPADIGLSHVAGVSQSATGEYHPPAENVSTVRLPLGSSWFRWNTTQSVAGGSARRVVALLDEIVVFVRAGAILPLHADGTIQHTGELGGKLLLQIYASADGAFELCEDDGTSLDYADEKAGAAATRTTLWT